MRHLVMLLVGVTLGVAGCTAPPPGGSPPATSDTGMGDMPGMAPGSATVSPPAEAAPAGDGLAGGVGGYVFVPTAGTVPAGAPGMFTFHINGPDGRPVTRYQPYEGELVQVDLIRSDLTNYLHIDPAMRQDGTWVVPLPVLPSGAYRAYVTFAAPDASAGTPLLYRLSHAFTVPGQAPDAPLPAPAASASVAGYTVTLSTPAGRPAAGGTVPLTLDIRQGGKPVGYFQRYLDGYAHLTAFRVGDLAAAHLGPAEKATGGQDLTSQALFPRSGTWRLFVQFRTSGPPITAAFTVTVD